jgi:ribosomal protein S18 acetylase RimI-like enzyme
VIGVLAAVSGRCVGFGLLRELDLWAPAHGIHHLELTVMAHNERAASLYRRVGYTVEGRRTSASSWTVGWPTSSIWRSCSVIRLLTPADRLRSCL